MAGYIGNAPVPQGTQTRDNFTATSSQTTFATSGYTPNYLDVYLNGIHLEPSDYTATNGSDIILSSPATAGDEVTVVAWTVFNPTDVSMDNLSDVSTSGIADGQALVYSVSSSGFIPGAAGGPSLGTDSIMRTNANVIGENITVPTATNAATIGPVTINTGYSVTLTDATSYWTII